MTRTEFNDVVTADGRITTQGIWMIRYNKDDYATERQMTYNLFIEANICEDILMQCTKTKTIRKKLGSSWDLTLKFQRWYREDTGRSIMIPDGALLIAAIHLGFDFEKVKGVPSFYMNISNRGKIAGRKLNDQRLATALNFY